MRQYDVSASSRIELDRWWIIVAPWKCRLTFTTAEFWMGKHLAPSFRSISSFMLRDCLTMTDKGVEENLERIRVDLPFLDGRVCSNERIA